jgi:hypothetical protein
MRQIRIYPNQSIAFNRTPTMLGFVGVVYLFEKTLTMIQLKSTGTMSRIVAGHVPLSNSCVVEN